MTKIFGIDISKWQKGIDLAKAKNEGAKFVIIRGAYSTSKDAQFETHYKNAKANGLNVGAYLYTMAKNETEAKNEATALINNVLKGKQFELPIYFDIEDKTQKALDKKTNTAIVKAFCDTLEKNGYFAGVYASKSFFADYLNDSELQKYAHWVAQWSGECTYKGNDGVLGMWQFGGETNEIRSNMVAGMICDQNYMFVDYPTIIKKAGLNGFKKATTSAPTSAAASATPAKTINTMQSAKSKLNGYANGKTFTVNASAPLRYGAGVKYGIISTLAKGTKVTFYGYYTGNYYYVMCKGKTGFIEKSKLS